MPEGQNEKSSGLSIQTLLISAAAAVAAATVVPLIWERGTIIATAMTPVIVALVSEGLKKPVQTVSAVAPRVARRSGTGAAVRRFEPAAAETAHPERVGARGDGPERFEPLPDHLRDDAPGVREDDPFGLRNAHRPTRPQVKIALITGLLAFVIAAGVLTVTELAAGGSVASNQRTSLFGGSTKKSKSKAKEKATPTATPEKSATPEGSATPTPTPTAPASPTPAVNLTPSPQPTATPGAATPAPTP